MSVYRCFVEKKQPFATEANGVKSDSVSYTHLTLPTTERV